MDQGFHASNNQWPVRHAAFDLIEELNVRIDSTLLEKAKTIPALQKNEPRMHQTAWWLHFKHVAPRIAEKHDELFVVAASLKTASKRTAFATAVEQVVRQVSPTKAHRTAFWPSASEPWLWIADYCAWAIQRKWERGDAAAYGRIRNRVATEFDVLATGHTLYD